MSVILVDAKYFGQYLKKARRDLRIKTCECGRMFGLSQRQIIKIENGRILPPEAMLEKIMANVMTMILSKRRK